MNNPKACVSCSQNCLKRHKKRTHDDPPTVCSFFKLMFGKNILQSLDLPPVISKMLASSVDKWIVLEDTNRLKWNVLLKEKQGCLAFIKGWDNFVAEHNIEMGDIVVFYFINNEHLLVEIYGRTGCPKVVNTNKNRTTDSNTPSSIPEPSAHKRPRNEPFMKSRHVPTRGESREETPWVEPCFMSRPEKHGPKVVPDDPIMSNREKARQKVAPVAETEVDPFMTNRYKTRSKMVPDDPIMINREKTSPKLVPNDPIMTNREKSRPKVGLVAETEVDPWSVPNREDFEFDERTPWVDSSSMEPKIVPVAETMVDPCLMTRRDKSSAVNDDRDVLFDLSRFETPVKKSTFDKEEETDYGQNVTVDNEDSIDDLMDLPDWVMPEIDITNASDKGQQDGEKVQPSNQEMKACNQEICGYSEKSSYGKFGDSSSHFMNVKGENMGHIKPESREVKQNIYADPMADYVYGGNNFLFSEHAKISSGIKVAENFSPTVKTEVKPNIIVKEEPEEYEGEDCDAASPATVVDIKCSVPTDTEDFLLLPEPLNLAGGRNRYITKRKQLQKKQLVLLRDHAGKPWPVLYNRENGYHVLTSGWKSFMKATNIQPGDECVFTVTNGESELSVQVIRSF